MKTLRPCTLVWAFTLALLALAFSTKLAQAQVDGCAPIVNALAQGIQADTCEVIAEGSACYASADLRAVLRQQSGHFSSPNDRVEIADLRRLDTQAPQGAAILVANTPEDAVKIFIFGDSSVDTNGDHVFTMYEQGSGPICENTPSGMLVQTPAGDTGQIVVNGVTIRLGSTAFISMDGVLLFDQDPRIGRRTGERNPEAALCSGFDSECDFGNCPADYRLVWGPFCREDWYDYIEPGLYRVTLLGSGRVQAGATDYNATQEDFAYGVQTLDLPDSYTFCYPGLEPGGTGFETLVKAVTRSARVDRIALEYLGADCQRSTNAPQLRPDEEGIVEDLMARFDAVRIAALRSLEEDDLDQVMSGSALLEQQKALAALRSSKCNWEVQEQDPSRVLAMQSVGSAQVRVYMLKNWDMDLVCSGRRAEMPDNDGNFVGVYIVQPVGGDWRVTEKRVYDVDEEETPQIGEEEEQELALMTVTNIEGSVEVTALGVTRVLLPGEQVRITLANYQPVDVGQPITNTAIPRSALIDWFSNDERGLPLVNGGSSGGPPPPTGGELPPTTGGGLPSGAGKIVFVTSRDYEASRPDEELRNAPDLGDQAIYVMNPDGSGQALLLSPVRSPFLNGDFAVSANGRQLAMSLYGDTGLIIYDLSSGASSVIADGESVFRVQDWSPDGRNLLVSLHRKTPNSTWGEIVLANINVETSAITELFTDSEARPQFAAWSPDGTRIAFTYHYQLWLMNADGSDQQMLTEDARDLDWLLDWSPRGGYIAYEAGSTSDQDIWIMEPDGSNRRNLTNSKGVTEYAPTWSPNGQQLAFTRFSFTDGYPVEQIYVMDVATGESRQLTTTGLRNAAPVWVPALAEEGGSVRGYTCFPSDHINPMTVYARNVATDETFSTHIALDQREFDMALPAGDYTFFSWTDEIEGTGASLGALFTCDRTTWGYERHGVDVEALLAYCGARETKEPVAVHVGAGLEPLPVFVCDYYLGDENIPVP